MNANSQFKEHEITTCCALRFDGYKYRQETGFDPKLAFDKLFLGEEVGELDGLAAMFFLQRELCKWGLVYETEDSKYYKLYRKLFLKYVDSEIPVQYRNEEWYNRWQDEYKPHIVEIKKFVQNIYLNSIKMSMEEIIIDKVKMLPADKQQEVLDFVEFLLAKIQNSMSKKGKFIDFYLPYSQDGNHISAKSQAEKILQEADTLLKKGSFGVAIIYSANYDQTKTIRKTYAEGGYKTGTSGANQANVMTEMEKLLDTNYQHLQGKIRIAPITTMTFLDFDGKDHITVVKDDLAQIQQMLENGWDILGWQNQTTIKSKNKYAVGGGVAKLSDDISNEIQSTLLSLASQYK
ncbi:DUF2281 domain-containing protein [Sphaerospermopsis sp. LEGE 08334]|uniref:DUF2281 domain-containing protein n=1 Tax=Sphaerospermopsis sp. LEGE 08334 TaxID=1828651 RepID=UPI001D156A9A|nr:DUF2281 domain-containing protein [Sphaerospermopsis sp. LEGE 08334]